MIDRLRSTRVFYFSDVRLTTVLGGIRFAVLPLYGQSIRITFRLYFTTHKYKCEFYKKKNV